MSAGRSPSGSASAAELDVSVVMPCLDEEAAVGQCVARALGWIRRSGLRGEVIVVDNGSTDRSTAVARQAGARVLEETARGYGRAVLRGVAEARGRIVVVGDADGTYDFSDLSPLVAPLGDGADLVLGNRFAGGLAPGAMPFLHRVLGTPINNALLRGFFGVRVGDSHSGLRAFRRDLLGRLGLSEAGFELTAEMLIRAARAGYRIAEVPAPYGPRQGKSKLSTLREGWRFLRFVLLAAPDFLFVVPGLALLLGGLFVFALAFMSPSGVVIGSLSWQPVFAGPILVAIGANALAFGVVAKLRGTARGLLPEDRAVRLYRRFFSLERVLIVAFTLVLAGAALDGYLFAVWASGGEASPGNHLAAVAQTLLLVGAQLGFAAFLVVTVDRD